MYKSWAGSGWKPGGSCVSPVSLLLLCWNVLQTRPAVGLMWTELLTDPGRGDVRRRRCWQVEESLWSERRNKQPLQSGRRLEGNAVRDVCASLATAEPHSAAGSSANRQFPSQSQDRLSAQSQKLDLKHIWNLGYYQVSIKVMLHFIRLLSLGCFFYGGLVAWQPRFCQTVTTL